jgi:hypothetical protein
MEKDAKAKSKHNRDMDQHVEDEIVRRSKTPRSEWHRAKTHADLDKFFKSHAK